MIHYLINYIIFKKI